MKRESRLREIARFLRVRSGCTIRELAEHLDVSHMTVRRDLAELQEEGTVRTVHGGVVYTGPSEEGAARYSVVSAGTKHVDEKSRIGARGASLVRESDVVLIDTGTTTEYIARGLPGDVPLTVICFSLNVLLSVVDMDRVDIIFPGGYFHPNTRMMTSPEAIELIRRNRATKAFISAAGVSFDLGVTCLNAYEIAPKQAALASSLSRILVADSSKFGWVQPALFAEVSDFDTVITDRGISQEYARGIQERGVELIVV
ncbi:MAG: DeoR/GlpR family DNA-binding transcription regulator [Spirochaetota bacterium]